MTRTNHLNDSVVFKGVAYILASILIFSGCAQNVIILPPYDQKLRVGDGVKLTVEDGTLHTGRIVYLDRASVVIRTPKQVISENPVRSVRFGTSIPWNEIRKIQVTGVLDSRKKLISNEEIRIKRRTNYRRNYAINFGLLGVATSFLFATRIQANISPTTADLSKHSPGKARLGFWSTWITGTVATAISAYMAGKKLDRMNTIHRIERERALERAVLQKALMDSLLAPTQTQSIR